MSSHRNSTDSDHAERAPMLADGVGGRPRELVDVFEQLQHLPTLKDPWQCLTRMAPGQPWMAWARPAEGRCWLAWGALEATDDFLQTPPRARSFHAAEQPAGSTQGVLDAPWWVGGCAFFGGRSALTDDWDGWPRSAGWVPSAVLTATDGGCLLIVRGLSAAQAGERLTQVREQLLRVEEDVTNVAAQLPRALAPDAALPAADDEARRRYEALVARATQAVRGANLRKLVVARSCRFEAPTGHRFDALASVRTLREQQPEATCFALSLSGSPTAVFIGATPERLVSVEGSQLSTHALAATAHPGGGDLDSDKMRDEHALVTAGLKRDLAPLCETLRVHPPRRLRAGTLEHLASDIGGELKRHIALHDVARVLHPTAALGGWPREAAVAWLQQNEQLERGWYGGPLGYVTRAGSGQVAVAIRSALVHDDAVTGYVGAGIVAASQPAEEWRETEAKLVTVARALRTRSAACSTPAAFEPRLPRGHVDERSTSGVAQ